MNSEPTIRRGDIFFADFGQGKGSEQSGVRPALVISNDIGNLYGPTVIVAALTSKVKAVNMPTHIVLRNLKGLKHRSMIVFEQIRTLDKSCLREKVAHLSEAQMIQADLALKVSIGLDEKYNQIIQAEEK